MCGGVSGNSGGGASGGGSCNLTLEATACNGAGNLPLKLLALMPGDFKFKSGHLRDYKKKIIISKNDIIICMLYYNNLKKLTTLGGCLQPLGSTSKLLLYK